MAVWSGAGALLGLVAGFQAGHPVLGAAMGGLIVFIFTSGVAEAAGRIAGALHAPSGRSTPHAPDYSRADALAVRGAFDEAVALLAQAVEADPHSPAPYLRIARLERDERGRCEEAARWLRRALAEARLGDAAATQVRWELVELYVHRLGAPERAAPILARMAEELAGTDQGLRAAAELAEVRARMREGPS